MTGSETKAQRSRSVFAEPAVTKHGGRVELRLLPDEPSQLVTYYLARFFVDDRLIEGKVTIEAPRSEKSHALIQIDAEELPSWLADFTVTLLRTTARSVFAEAGTAAVWPRRLTRWRKAPNQ